MRTLPIPQAPGIAGRPLSPAEIAGIVNQARSVDRLARRVGRDIAQGVRILLASMALGHTTRGAGERL
jgi:hypothetical protein